jgi:hypothetical protein
LLKARVTTRLGILEPHKAIDTTRKRITQHLSGPVRRLSTRNRPSLYYSLIPLVWQSLGPTMGGPFCVSQTLSVTTLCKGPGPLFPSFSYLIPFIMGSRVRESAREGGGHTGRGRDRDIWSIKHMASCFGREVKLWERVAMTMIIIIAAPAKTCHFHTSP